MSFLRHVEACNNFDPLAFRLFRHQGGRLGLIRHDYAQALADYPALFTVSEREVRFANGLKGRQILTETVDRVTASLVERGVIAPLRHEPFAIMEKWGGEVLFEIDRGAVPFFGTRSYGVHLNGIVGQAGDLMLWIGKRAQDKKVAPGKLDNLVAGGISSGYGAGDTLVKEADEEAAISPDLAAQAVPVGALRYRMAQDEGLRDDVLFVYDLVLPADFQPKNQDGEIEAFYQMRVTDCLQRVADTDDFKFNVNLILIDLGIRRGLIGPDHPEYLALNQGLAGGLVQEIS